MLLRALGLEGKASVRGGEGGGTCEGGLHESELWAVPQALSEREANREGGREGEREERGWGEARMAARAHVAKSPPETTATHRPRPPAQALRRPPSLPPTSPHPLRPTHATRRLRRVRTTGSTFYACAAWQDAGAYGRHYGSAHAVALRAYAQEHGVTWWASVGVFI